MSKKVEIEPRVTVLEQQMKAITERVDAIDKELDGVALIQPASEAYEQMVDELFTSAVADAHGRYAQKTDKKGADNARKP